MVLEAGDHQKTQEDIDFMLINGLIIISASIFECKSFNLLCLRRQKFSFFVILGRKTKNSVFSYIAATALGPSSKVRARSEDSRSYTNITVRPLSVEL